MLLRSQTVRRDPLLVLNDDLVKITFAPVVRFMTAVSKEYHRILSPRLIHLDSVEVIHVDSVDVRHVDLDQSATMRMGNVTLAVNGDGQVFAIRATIPNWPRQAVKSEVYIYLSKARTAPEGLDATVYDSAPFRVFGKTSSNRWAEYKNMNVYWQVSRLGHLYARGIIGAQQGVRFCLGPTEAPTLLVPSTPTLVPFYKDDKIAVRCQFPNGVAVHGNSASTPHMAFRVWR